MPAWIALALATLAAFQLTESRYSLHLEDTLFLPFEYSPIPRYAYDSGAGGRVRYDTKYNFAYVVGRELIHVIDMNDLLHLDNIYHVHEEGFHFTDLAVCGEFVLTSADNENNPDNGKLFVFRKYNNVAANMPLLQVINLPHNPKHMDISNDCQKVVISLEGAGYYKDGVFTDPEGAVALVTFPSADLNVTAAIKILDFTSFNSQAPDYVSRGVRYIYTNSTFSQDLEPEGISLRHDDKVAYVSLQENNAIAMVDVSSHDSAAITEIFPLGVKAWHDLLMDPSDWDQDIRLQKWEVYGLYQPDSIHYFEVDNVGYLLCANEGASKTYGLDFTEVKRGQDFMLEGLVHPGVSQGLKDSLLTASNLGRLEFSTIDGKLPEGTYNRFYSFGGRSFSFRRADNASTMVYDSGSLTAQHHETFAPVLFNTDPTEPSRTMLQSRDARSDNKGPEPEAVEVGVIDGEKLFFIGNERSSSVEVYSVRHGVTKPIFHNITFLSNFVDVGKTWQTLYTERNTGDLSPEGLAFISARDSPILKPLLLVSGSVSGTLSVYIVSKSDDIDDDYLAQKVNSLFDIADVDGDELLTREEHEHLVTDSDLDDNKRVDKSEFFTSFQQKIGLLETKLDFVFNELDVDNNRHLTSFDTNALFYLADRDATSSLARTEFGREWKRIMNENIELGA